MLDHANYQWRTGDPASSCSSSTNPTVATTPIQNGNVNRLLPAEVQPKPSIPQNRAASLEETAAQSNNSRHLLVSGIKFKKFSEGAHISWDPPLSTAQEITEYSVWLIIKGNSLLQVYCGILAQCTVSNASLSSAGIDTTSKPAIIFRIAAKNGKDYGTGTKIRWLLGKYSFCYLPFISF